MNKKTYNILRAGLTLLSVWGISFEITASAIVPAVPNGQAPKITALKIQTPSGSVVEASTTDDALRSVALEVTIEADAKGVQWFKLCFQSPDGKKIAAFQGYSESPTESDPLKPMYLQKQTYFINKQGLNQWNPFNKPACLDIDAVGTWKLVGAETFGRNGKYRSYAVDTKQLRGSEALPSGLTSSFPVTSFTVTRFFSQQPSHTSVAPAGSLKLAPVLATNPASPKYQYQWYRNGVAIPNAKSLTFSKAGVSIFDAGLYQLEITSAGTKVRSDSVVVSVRTQNVTAARNAISNQNGANAASYAAKALAESPTSSEALFVSALSALYNTLADVKNKQYLTAMGLNLAPKFPLPAKALENYKLPTAANSATISDWIDKVLLPSLQTASGQLAKITDRSFVSFISPSDLKGWGLQAGDATPLIVDYGDVQMAQAYLNGAIAVLNLTTSVNSSVLFSWFSSTAKTGRLSLQTIATQYPLLLTASTTGAAKQHASVQALGRMADVYLNFSDFMYNRTGKPAPARLVTGDRNLFPALDLFEQDAQVTPYYDLLWRDYAANVKASISSGTRPFVAEHSEDKGVVSRYPINLKALDTRPAGFRSSLPIFTKNAVGAIPNPTFNGVLPSLTSPILKARLVAAKPQIDEGLNTK